VWRGANGVVCSSEGQTVKNNPTPFDLGTRVWVEWVSLRMHL
jgi:hypothetical protein